MRDPAVRRKVQKASDNPSVSVCRPGKDRPVREPRLRGPVTALSIEAPGPIALDPARSAVSRLSEVNAVPMGLVVPRLSTAGPGVSCLRCRCCGELRGRSSVTVVAS
jgi:hypothetical protein